MLKTQNKNLALNILRVIGLAVLLLFIFSQPAGAQETTPELFTESINMDGRSIPQTTLEVIRKRWADVDFNLLARTIHFRSGAAGGDQPAFVFNLFVDVRYPAYVDHVLEMENGSLGIIGNVGGGPYNEFVMVFRDGVLQGTIQDGQNVYEIRYQEGGHLIVEVDSSAYPDSLEPQVPDPWWNWQQGDSAPRENSTPAADSGEFIDVLAVYTPAAREAVGGVTAMEAKIQQAILSTNEGYANSGVAQQVHLVGMEEVNYNEIISGLSDSEMWYHALDRLTWGQGATDPSTANYLADARAYRDAYGADLVFMVTELPYKFCGLGWLAGGSSGEAYGYSVVHNNCTGTTAYSVQHEMGHNMGACHDRNNTSEEAKPYCYNSYAFGYQQPNQFYTVMSYQNGCGTCSRINRWSNPDLTYNGYPTGVPVGQPDEAANAFTLNETAFNVANYRESVAISGAFLAPGTNGIAMIPRTILAVSASSRDGAITQVTFRARYNGAWQMLHTDSEPADGWQYQWPTAGIAEQTIALEAVIEDIAGNKKVIAVTGVSLSRTYPHPSGFEYRQGGRGEPVSFPVQVLHGTEDVPEDYPDLRRPSRYLPRNKMHFKYFK